MSCGTMLKLVALKQRVVDDVELKIDPWEASNLPIASNTWLGLRHQWKMIVKEDQVQLFNLQDDPKESTDVTARHPEITRSMREAIEEFKAEVTAGS